MASGRAAATRERLLAAAGIAFAKRGFHATTTRDIAAAAGMSPAAVYVHHESKEELLYLIALDGHLRTRRLISDAIERSDGPTAQLHALMYDFAAFQAEQHAIARVINYELASLNEAHLQEIQRLRKAIQRDVRAIVKRGVAEGEFTPNDPLKTTMALLSLGVDIARWYRQDATWPPSTIAAFYADLALRIVGAETKGKT
ncbi:MAG: TetR family transcriptional regulator [Candidatus Nanopelagicales bacterium]